MSVANVEVMIEGNGEERLCALYCDRANRGRAVQGRTLASRSLKIAMDAAAQQSDRADPRKRACDTLVLLRLGPHLVGSVSCMEAKSSLLNAVKKLSSIVEAEWKGDLPAAPGWFGPERERVNQNCRQLLGTVERNTIGSRSDGATVQEFLGAAWLSVTKKRMTKPRGFRIFSSNRMQRISALLTAAFSSLRCACGAAKRGR